MKRQTGNYIIVTLSALIMVLTVYIGTSWLKRVKVDMTEEKLYTLSDGSKTILGKLNTPLTLKLYYSKTLRGGLLEFEPTVRPQHSHQSEWRGPPPFRS